MHTLEGSNLRNLTRDELIHYADIEGDPVVRQLIQKFVTDDDTRIEQLESEIYKLENQLDNLGDEYADLEGVADEANLKLREHIDKLEDVMQYPADELRDALQRYIDELSE